MKLFVQRTGVSKADNNIDYAVLEDCARECLDKTAPRAMAVLEPLREQGLVEPLVVRRKTVFLEVQGGRGRGWKEGGENIALAL